MTNVAIDVFQMPRVKIGDKNVDCMIVCVDRHSGWIVATPETYDGLTGTAAAKAMLKEWYGFEIPSTSLQTRVLILQIPGGGPCVPFWE